MLLCSAESCPQPLSPSRSVLGASTSASLLIRIRSQVEISAPRGAKKKIDAFRDSAAASVICAVAHAAAQGQFGAIPH